MNYVLDSNVVIYAQQGNLSEALPRQVDFIVVITECELLPFPDLTAQQPSG